MLARTIDKVQNVPVQELYGEVVRQTVLTSIKGLFGYVCVLGTVFLAVLLSYRLWRKIRFHEE